MLTLSWYPGDPRPRRAVDALLKAGMSVDLICLSDENKSGRETSGKLSILRVPITHRRGGAASYAWRYSAFIFVSSVVLALRSLRRRYDMVYVHNMPDILVLSSLFPKALGAKVVLDLHDPMPELMMTIFNVPKNHVGVRLIRRLEKWSVARANLVITVNAACHRIFTERGCAPDKIEIVMNSPDSEIFRLRSAHSYPAPAGQPEKPFVIMYHGSLVERNGLDLAVSALARIRDHFPGAVLRIYGAHTPFLGRVLEDVRKKGLTESVQYLGLRSLEQLIEAIEGCDVGVIPNHWNEFTEINTPTRIFEYLSQGKPVIAPRTRGIMDYFGPESLLFFDPGDSEDLARQLEYVILHPGEIRATVDRGQQVLMAHTWSREKEILLHSVSGLLTAPVSQ